MDCIMRPPLKERVCVCLQVVFLAFVPFSMAFYLLLSWILTHAQYLEIRAQHHGSFSFQRVTRAASCTFQVVLGNKKPVAESILDLCPDLHLFCCVSLQFTVSELIKFTTYY